MKRHVFIIYFLFSIKLFSQISDDFEDGNFTSNPVWAGTENFFKINTANQLQLNDFQENISFLSTPNNLVSDTEWQCWIKLSFSPSANNNARFYLASNKNDLSLPLNGYYLQFGESGSNDAIELFRQNGEEVISILRSEDGIISSSFEIRVKVINSKNGDWKLYLDTSGGENFILEAEGFDDSSVQSEYLGFFCNYTKSNSTKMYFDDVYCGSIQIDTIAPEVTDIKVPNDSSLILTFSEYIDEESILTDNFSVNMEIGNPDHVSYNDGNHDEAILQYSEKFGFGNEYILHVVGIKDMEGNQMNQVYLPFSYYIPQPHDIVINEIMADPTPAVGLPEAEYLELWNTTNKTINLDGWTLKIGSSEKAFSQYKFEADSYLIIGKDDYTIDFENYGEFFGFSSFSLTNSAQTVELFDEKGILISGVSYDDSWYADIEKELGGWSLEQINYKNICSGKENWSVSNNENGGTPGFTNSVDGDVILKPQILGLQVITDSIIRVTFNQIMDQESIIDKEKYKVDQERGNPVNSYSLHENTVDLIFSSALVLGIVYELTIFSGLNNCSNISITSDTILQFGLPELPDYHDIVINEILFNPLSNGEDYVELYNRSEKVIDLDNIQIASVKHNPPNPIDTLLCDITNKQLLILPNDYVLLTSSTSSVLNQYYSDNPEVFHEVEYFPPYNNDEGHVILSTRDNNVIDTFSYSEKLHFPLLNYYDGVSLERINPDVFISDNSNWHSASESAGFGTPGYLNSQSNLTKENHPDITIDPEIFSPDNDGYDDIQNINYSFAESGNVLSISIYNSEGYLIRELITNEYIGTSGSFSWDGLNDNNTISASGIYIYLITIFNETGYAAKIKKTGVLSY